MKILMAAMMIFSATAFAQSSGGLVGENASKEHRDCLAEDKCPSQRCANSCAMINSAQFKDDRTSSTAPKKGKKASASAQ